MGMYMSQGEYAIRAFGRVIRVDAWGTWGVDQTLAYAHDLKRRIEGMPAHFSIMAVSHGQSLRCPEAEAIMRYSVRWRITRGCVAQATVVGDRMLADMARTEHKTLYVNEGLKQDVFCTSREAETWLAGQGFPEAANIEMGAILDLENLLGITHKKGFGKAQELMHFEM
jgi:hypothetical protein